MKKFLLLLILNSVFYILNSFCFAQNKNDCGKSFLNVQSKLHRTIDSLHNLIGKDKSDTNKITHLNKLSFEYISIGLYDSALYYGNAALQYAILIASETKQRVVKQVAQKGIANSYNCIGSIYYYQANYPKTLEYFLKALKIDEELKNDNGIAKRMGNIGLVYLSQADFPKSQDYFFKALKMEEELGDKNGIAIQMGNNGLVYFVQKNYPKALNYFFKALKMAQDLGDKNGIERNLGNIGAVYVGQKDYSKALSYYFHVLKLSEESGNKSEMAAMLSSIGSIYSSTGKFKEAEQYFKKAITLDEKIGTLDYLREAEEALSQVYDTIGQNKLALIHYKKAITLKDTLFSQENKKQLIRKEMNYEFDKKEAATKAENEKQQAVASAEKHTQQFVLILVSCVLVLVFLFAGFIFRSLRITRKQKNIIELQKNEVFRQKEIVEKQKEKIIDSITYAQRIQQSILMEETEIQNYLPDSFIYYQPKDIVSGDFYWCSKTDGKIIIAAVDCTGHGVPGAFMSMIGNTLLNQIVNEKYITKPSEILRLLNLGVYDALHQEKDGALSPDRMDIALCTIDYNNNEMQYAGAQNPLYVISNGQVGLIKADIYGIGGGGLLAKLFDPLKIEYTNHIIKIKKGMSIYLFSDGFIDQFGGPDEKKIGSQKFKELLLNNQHLSMQKQKEMLASAHEDWKGGAAQIDDILVIGVKI